MIKYWACLKCRKLLTYLDCETPSDIYWPSLECSECCIHYILTFEMDIEKGVGPLCLEICCVWEEEEEDY